MTKKQISQAKWYLKNKERLDKKSHDWYWSNQEYAQEYNRDKYWERKLK